MKRGVFGVIKPAGKAIVIHLWYLLKSASEYALP
jgi:hypothetical protein